MPPARLVSRSLPHPSAHPSLHPLTISSQSHPAAASRPQQRPQPPAASSAAAAAAHPPDKSSSAFIHPSSSHPRSSAVHQLRRYWKKLNETDSTGKRSRFAKAFVAFKMGLYFKLLITFILLVRFASHSSQRAFPNSARLPEDHFRLVASTPHTNVPAARIVVITQPGYSDRLQFLLKSLTEADYDRDPVALDVWMFSSSACNYLPLPLYPLAMALFGPPRFDHSIPRVVHHLHWHHGPKTLVATRTEPDVAHAWQSNRVTCNETLVFVDATNVQSVSPRFYVWLKRARAALDNGRVTAASVLSLDAIPLADGVPHGDNAVLVDAFFPATGVFSPTGDVWVTFQKWFALRTRSFLSRPRLPGVLLHVGGYSLLEAMRMYPTHAWFAQFLSEYRERVLHPILPDRQTLLVRPHGTTAGAIPGSGRRPNSIPRSLLHLDRRAERDANLCTAPDSNFYIPQRPVVVRPNLSVSSIAADDVDIDHARDHDLDHNHELSLFGSSEAINKYRDVRQAVGSFARARGSDTVSLMLVSADSIDVTHSWLCNVGTLGIVPHALVMVAADDHVANQLTAFVKRRAHMDHDTLVVSMRDALTPLSSEAAMRGVTGSITGQDRDRARHVLAVMRRDPGWRLMLLRTLLLRDLLGDGLGVLQLDVYQVWFNDPMPYIQHALSSGDGGVTVTAQPPIRSDSSAAASVDDARSPDAVVMEVSGGHELTPGLMFVRPTVGARHLFGRVVDRLFFLSASASFAAERRLRKGMVTEQSIVTALVCGKDWSYARRFPRIKAALLERQLFVDRAWLEAVSAKKTAVGMQQQQQPVVARMSDSSQEQAQAQKDKNGAAARLRVQQGLWFTRINNTDSPSSCDRDAVARLVTAFVNRPRRVDRESGGSGRRAAVAAPASRRRMKRSSRQDGAA